MVKYLGILLGCAALMVGCSDLNNESFDGMDGNAGAVAMEISQASKAVMEGTEAGSFLPATTQKAAADTSIKWTYENGKWIGDHMVTVENGTVTRKDTVSFTGGGIAVLDPSLSTVDNITHNWATKYTGNGGLEVDVDVQSTGVLSKPAGGDTTVTLNGVGGCAMQGVGLISSTVNDVIVPKSTTEAEKWDYPQSGTVNIIRPFRTIDITFNGTNMADVLVTNKVNSKTHEFKANLDTGEEVE